jgi:serpin B
MTKIAVSRSASASLAARVRLAAGLLLVAVMTWGCTGQAAAVGLAKSAASRDPGNADEAAAAAAAIDAFGFDLYLASGADTNLVLSPTSIVIALSMARAGARGATASEMDAVLHDAYGSAGGNGMNSLDQVLVGLSGTFTTDSGEKLDVKLHIANAPFSQSGMKLEDDYLDILASKYGAGLRLVDYAADPSGSCKLINAWVSDQTEKRIPELLDSLDPMTRLVLVNAIYLKAPWQTPFQVESTKDASFTKLDGSSVQVPTMNGTLSEAKYAAGTGWKAAELPYIGGSLAMTIVVPDDLTSWENGLTGSSFAQVVDALQPASVTLSLPKFGTETKLDLAAMLEAMGMPTAFNPVLADFSGITTAEQLYIAQVIHQANIDVDEKGTEAAAATAVVMRATAMPAEPVTLNVDRPFMFALRDTKTGAVLFLGRIVDPSTR